MVHALALTQICKAYQVVKPRQSAVAPRSPHLHSLTRLLLGETFGVLGSREVTTIPALDNISFTVEPGQVVGLFGKNGSGKTTLLSILGGVFPADSGSVHCFGHDMRTELATVRKFIVPIFGWLDAITWAFTGRQNIEKFLLMHHVEPGPLADQIEELAQAIDLADRLDDRAARYSQGMRIKLQVIVAILLQRAYGRSLLLLDEPFIGLDLVTQRYLRHFVGQELRRDNFSMLLATHQPDDIEALCDEVIVLDRGRVLAKDSVANLRRMVRRREALQLVYVPDGQMPLLVLPACPGVDTLQTIQRNGLVETKMMVDDSSATLTILLPPLLQANCRLISIQTQPMSFGDVLLQLITPPTNPKGQTNHLSHQ
ncbi:MAG TPA: ABC transporter ATP-binding protein [Caldilineaceae bacterium]|nr:ABC transporter ATP-binding protein [Caldilineaceae bacterium]